MLVRHFMTRDVVTLREDDLCVDAYAMFRSKRMRRAPVVRDGKLIGMISDRDLLRALPWSAHSESAPDHADTLTLRVGDYMTKRVIQVSPRTHLEDVARLMLEHKIGGLPVVDRDKLVGIITESDIFKVFVRMSVQAHGVRVTVQAPETREDADPVDACRSSGQHLSGLARYVSPAGTTMMTMHVTGPGADALPEKLAEMGFVLIDVARPAPSEG